MKAGLNKRTNGTPSSNTTKRGNRRKKEKLLEFSKIENEF